MPEEPSPLEISSDAIRDCIYLRGLFIQRYSGIEFSLTHLLVIASLHPAYSDLGELPYSVKGKLKRFGQVLDRDGPMQQHSRPLREMHTEFTSLEEFRHFMVHGIMVPRIENEQAVAAFRLYQHIEGNTHWGFWTLSLEEMNKLATRMQPLSTAFTQLVAKIGREAKVVIDGFNS